METTEQTTEIAEYSPLAAGLAELRRRYEGVVFDCRTADGDGQARRARKELVTLRTSLESKRRELKEPALLRSRLIDSEAKRIEAAIRAVEQPIDEQIRAVEQEREAERQRRLQEIAARVAEQRRQIVAAFAMLPPLDRRRTAAELREHRAQLARVQCGQFGDLAIEADETQRRALEWLDGTIADAMRYEIEQAEIARERAEMAEQRAREAAERREQDTAAERAREEAAAQQRAAEEARRAELQAEEERLIAERRRLQAERAEIEWAQAAQREQLRAAEERDAAQAERVRMAAPAMLDCLRQWRVGEERPDADELANARAQRDHLIEILTPQPAEEAPR